MLILSYLYNKFNGEEGVEFVSPIIIIPLLFMLNSLIFYSTNFNIAYFIGSH